MITQIHTELFLSHAKSAEGAELYSLLLTLALEGSQLHATEGAEVDGRRDDERKTENVDSLKFNVYRTEKRLKFNDER